MPNEYDATMPPTDTGNPEDADLLEQVLTAKAAADAFEVTYDTLLQHLKIDALPCKRIGHTILVLREDVEAFLRAHPRVPSRFTRAEV